MFTDYYAVLEIKFPSNQEEIKKAFRVLAKNWHPDINDNPLAHEQMILINEAYLFLSDMQRKERYDQTYILFKNEFNTKKEDKIYSGANATAGSYTYDYNFSDEVLKDWIRKVKKQAVELVNDTVSMSKVAIKEGGIKTGQMIMGQILLGVLITIIVSISKSCN
ncbi:DnaJ domain-containing protein [Niabella aquatica]